MTIRFPWDRASDRCFNPPGCSKSIRQSGKRAEGLEAQLDKALGTIRGLLAEAGSCARFGRPYDVMAAGLLRIRRSCRMHFTTFSPIPKMRRR